jgi:hypothetical protein
MYEDFFRRHWVHLKTKAVCFWNVVSERFVLSDDKQKSCYKLETLNLCSSLNVKKQVSHPHNATNKTVVVYVFSLVLVDLNTLICSIEYKLNTLRGTEIRSFTIIQNSVFPTMNHVTVYY